MTLVYSCRDIVFRVPSLEVLRSSFRSRIMSDYRAWGSPRRVEVPMLLLKELLSTLILIIQSEHGGNLRRSGATLRSQILMSKS